MTTALLLCCALAAQDTTFAETESGAHTLEYLKTPDGCVLEIGGMDFLSDGRLVVSTRRGQVWIVDDPLGEDFENAKVTLFHEGLWEGLGLSVVDDEIHVLQRGELSKLVDSNGDGRCDVVETVASDWGLSGHYHEFAFGLPRDSRGDWWMGLNVSFGDPEWWHGRSTVPYRGWILRVSPDGTVTPWASGVRSPNGIALDSKDRLFVTDNQGDWIASSPIYHIVEGGFYGHPKSLNWTEEYRASGKLAHDEIPPARAATGRTAPAIWIPYKWSRSTGNLLEDRTGSFGIPKGQFVVAELTNGMLLRAGFEEVQGQLQGWVLPLRQEIGSVNRVLQAPDGTVFCGLTNRGWGGKPPADGLVRVRSTRAETMEFGGMTLLDFDEETETFGFELTFSHPVHADWSASAESVKMISYDYDYWWEYGSPERHTQTLELEAVELSEDRKTLVVRSFDIYPATCVRIALEGVTAESGAPLLHPEISYTINQLPSGAPTNAYVAKMVPPPPSKGDVDAGVLRLSWGDALGQFESTGWELCDAALDAADATKFATGPGNGALVNVGPKASDFVTRGSFGDAHLHAEFMLPKGGRSAVQVADLGRIELTDDAATCGSFGDLPPSAEAYTAAGEWCELDVYYRLAKDDAPAFLDRVVLNGTAIHEGVEVSGTGGARGPVRFLGTEGAVALRNIQVKPLDRPADAGGWEFLNAAETWDDWELMGDCTFDLENEELVGKGALGWLWAPIDELGDVTVRARVKINANGAGALIVRAADGDDGVDGYAVRVNASFPDGALTGSVRAGSDGPAASVASELIAADTWVDLEVDVRDGDGGTTVTVSLNGVVVNEMVDPEGRSPGGIALRCDHDGTVFKVQNIRLRR
ncbi:MAG: family 16 glycoside hydrolase [Planctomycetota bacterium]